MTDLAEDISALVESIVLPLVEFPDEVEIETSFEEATLYVDLRVHPDDAGKVIGRQGRVIKAIRTLARAAAATYDYQVEVELLD